VFWKQALCQLAVLDVTVAGQHSGKFAEGRVFMFVMGPVFTAAQL